MATFISFRAAALISGRRHTSLIPAARLTVQQGLSSGAQPFLLNSQPLGLQVLPFESSTGRPGQLRSPMIKERMN
jgi:hypothetical protein